MNLLTETLEFHDLPLEIVKPHENLPMETTAEHPMVKRLLVNDPKLAGARWSADAAHLSSGGIQSICIGPGSIDQAHTADEFIEVAALQQGAEFFILFVRGLAG